MTSPKAETDSSSIPKPEFATDILPSDEYSQYLLRARSEMFTVFRGMVESVSQITMIFNEGQDMVLTSLVSYGDSGLVFEFGASTEMNKKALKASKLFCVTHLQKVEIQYILRGLKQIEVDGASAFHAAMPESILRLQRRENYRLTTPIVRPLKCKINLTAKDGSVYMVEAQVVDISGTGVRLAGLPNEMPLETGMEIPGCSIELPEIGSIETTLHLHWLAESVSRAGASSHRAGCAFVKLPRQMATLIQRYIFKIERERKARDSGLA